MALALGVESVRLEPDADTVGLEVPRADPQPVLLLPLMEDADWPRSPVAFALGRDVGGRPWVADLARMPHLLIAGATGSGKSVAVNALLVSVFGYIPARGTVKIVSSVCSGVVTPAGAEHQEAIIGHIAERVNIEDREVADIEVHIEAKPFFSDHHRREEAGWQWRPRTVLGALGQRS